MANYNLRTLLHPWVPCVPKCILKGITLDSRTVIEGYLFIAIIGHKIDARRYIPQAITQGAIAVLSETESKDKEGEIHELHGVPIIYLYQLKTRLSLLAGRFYKNPSHFLSLVAVTGTNGKTSTSHLLAQWVQLLGNKTGVMGTIGNGALGNIHPSKNTTESPFEIQKTLSNLKLQGVRFAAMEVSSHALVQDRVNNVFFSAAVFTNLSRDHLDYHKDMEKYESAKWTLFNKLAVNQHIINADDATGRRWLKTLKKAIAVTLNKSLPIKWKGRWLSAGKVRYHAEGTEIPFRSTWGNGTIQSPLVGKINTSNILLALTTLLALGYPLLELVKSTSYLQPVCGRMEVFRIQNRPMVMLDYAHNPDALKKILIDARLYCEGKLWCIFGCGGERDKGKRPIMGAIAEQYADQVIITDDNPRNEKALDIINDIQRGLLDKRKIQVISNRTHAITMAIMQATTSDLVVVAGKGHENYQIIGQHQLYFSDRILIARLLKGQAK
ncbi:UDP-N-acetylmuramyl-tripeptide synthetase [secondary endosymbiont of Heteropsylla cubana]|uniref:UDP-N-acetylmuramoyl-L-alanyl-D-glutamate--2,6-diaminopimelate ligase n=1 Tax=secondary endosymbiont of Heteropsylla cubana TaxID=134287 RepID=J3TZ17_9ENTR|nr:UDP-N-acetylmuramoyl-L-alanyl-D-glutamate--2,6-diaminopimelate ligase [secondary endosymbiont of Heteropsylla cubana]AFP85695.1 UDP-N-acetylmuramyl-tripeptide synthetase [secondary endosymbiont of Heteropsylla cubana]